MKAIQAGNVIGSALADFDGTQSTNQIDVQLRIGYDIPEQSGGNALQGSSLSLSGAATINGNMTIGANLYVSGSTSLANLTVSGDATFTGNITVQNISVQNITINGHIITAGNAPVVAVSSAAGVADALNSIAAPTAQISGNDTAGTITIVAGANTTIGEIANLTFATGFGASPRILLTPVGSDSAKLQIYVNATTTTGFVIGSNVAPAAGTTYIYNYQVMQ
jgi:hypothetical protein